MHLRQKHQFGMKALRVPILLAGFLSITASAPGKDMLAVRSFASDLRTAQAALYEKLPLAFTVNQGQAEPRVKFLSTGSGYSLFLTSDEAVLAFEKPSTSGYLPSARPDISRRAGVRSVVRMRLVNARPTAKVRGLEELPGTSNYFIGNERSKWRTGLPNYAEVQYEDVYPGIDLVYYGYQRQLEFDFVVAPGADPRSIQLAFASGKQVGSQQKAVGSRTEAQNRGLKSQSTIDNRKSSIPAPLRIDANGDLVLETAAGEVRFRRPVAYQCEASLQKNTSGGSPLPNGCGTRHPIDARYILTGTSSVAFQIAPYDAKRPLVIDPVLGYSTFLGGSGNEYANSIAVDCSGNSYVTGYTFSTDFPTSNPIQPSNIGAPVAFVAKLNATGSALVYSTYLGGSAENYGQHISLDPSGNAFVTGYTNSTDFPTANPIQGANAGGYDAFVAKLNGDGSALICSSYIGGSGDDYGYGIAVDSTGNSFVTGLTSSVDFPVTSSAVQKRFKGGGYDAFVVKINASGSALAYSTYLGGSGEDQGRSIDVDAGGNAYVTGETNSADFPTLNALQGQTGGGQCGAPGNTIACFDAFVAKLDPTGSTLVYSTYLGGSGGDYGYGIAVDVAGAAYLTGYTTSADFPTTAGGFQQSFGGAYDAFVAKVSPDGSSLVYSTYFGGIGMEVGNAIAVGSDGSAYIAGSVYGGVLPTVDSLQATSGGFYDVFVMRLDAQGSTVIFSTYFGGQGNEEGRGIALDPQGSAYIAGGTFSTDFPVTPGALQSTYAGGAFDAFVFRVDFSPQPRVSLSKPSLAFADQVVGTTSSAQMIDLSNSGDATLELTNISADSDFAESNTCGSSVPAGGSCSLSISFSPSAPGDRSGKLTISDNSLGSPHIIPLSGKGVTGLAITISPASLNFPSQLVGSTSAAQGVTVSNSGNAELGIAGVNASGDFSATSNCPASLKPGENCAVSVTFNPKVAGPSVGAVTINDQAPGNPHVVPLAGTGIAPGAVLSLAKIDFGSQSVGTASDAKTVNLTNNGSATLNISGISTNGDFSSSNDCGLRLGAGSSCTIGIKFAPAAPSARTGLLSIADDAAGSPQQVTLAGLGVAPGIALTPVSLVFPDQGVGTTSAVQVVTLSNTGSADLNISGITVSGDFTISSSCGKTLSVGANCPINVTMKPSAMGTIAGSLAINDNAIGSPHTVALTGRGVTAYSLATSSSTERVPGGTDAATFIVAASSSFGYAGNISLACSGNGPATCTFSPATIIPGQASSLMVSNLSKVVGGTLNLVIAGTSDVQKATVPVTVLISDFSISSAPSSANVVAGHSASYTLSFAPLNGFSGTLSLACTDAPKAATCTPSATAITLDGSSAQLVTVTVSTTTRTMVLPSTKPKFRLPHAANFVFSVLALLLVMFTLALITRPKRLRIAARPVSLGTISPVLATILFALLFTACGGGGAGLAPPPIPDSQGGTPAGDYSIIFTATTPSGNLSHRVTLGLKVN